MLDNVYTCTCTCIPTELRTHLLSLPPSLPPSRAKNSVKHFPVRWEGKEFSFGFGKFQTVAELLEHFESKPVIGGESGTTCTVMYMYTGLALLCIRGFVPSLLSCLGGLLGIAPAM